MLTTGTVFLVALLSFSVYAAMQEPSVYPTLAQTGNVEEESKTGTGLTTINPTLVNGSSSIILLGSVLSHETANIYPRRDGIVEDILIDIGDTVEKNQVVALLLPKGVEGQSAAMITEKQVRTLQAKSDLSTAMHVAGETIRNAQQNIQEQETALLIARREQDMLFQKFAESEEHIAQMREQALAAVQQARQLIEWTLLGSSSRSGDTFQENDLSYTLGIQDANNMARYDAVQALNALTALEQSYTAQKPAIIDRLLPLASDALQAARTLLQYTPTETSGNGIDTLSYQQLSDRLSRIITMQDALYKAKEKLEDAHNSLQLLAAKEPELYRASQNGTDTAKSNSVRLLEEQLQTAHNALALTEAGQENMLEMKRKNVDISQAMLQSEYAQSGHREIRSPFSGIVSKRFITVGQIVMPSMPAFELTNVPTTLAKRAKTEIQFGLPEQYIDAVAVGDTVTFFLQADETIPYDAEVTRKSPQVDMKTHTITVQAKVPDELSLPHGTSIRIRFVDEKRPVFRLPSAAVKREADRNYIWLLDPDTQKPMQQSVSVIAEDGEFAEVTGNIGVESDIILDPPSFFLMRDHD